MNSLSRTPLTGGKCPLPQIFSKTDRHSEIGEAAFESSRQNAPEPCLTL